MLLIGKVLHMICMAIIFTIRAANAEFYSATADLQNLLKTQEIVMNQIEEHINNERENTKYLSKVLKVYKTEHKKAMKDPDYIKNPINSFTLIKRLTRELDDIEFVINENNEFQKDASVTYPTEVDLKGAALALGRLQETYHLNVTELSQGVLTGHFSTPMSISDCYEVGRYLYDDDYYSNSLHWMKAALNKYRNGDRDVAVNLVDIVTVIAYDYIALNDTANAYDWCAELTDMSPDNETKEVIENYEKRIATESTFMLTRKETFEDIIESMVMANEPKEIEYEVLCRGETVISSEISKRLKCRYLTESHPFLRLAPIKMEELYLDPDMYLFHDILSDSEIEHVKDLAKPMLNRSLVLIEENDGIATYRVSKTAWLQENETEVLARISRRVGHMTGFNMTFAEQFQVLNYGIGGHFEPHHDSYPENKLDPELGNRVATALFYMSDVAQGGATVFPKLGLSVFPTKGAALLWPNLHHSGEYDMATLHAGCPVLCGEKWVINSWISEVGQELVKPCNLEHDLNKILIREMPSILYLQE